MTQSPWERWTWVVAGVWLVFLAYPVVETFQADLSWVARGLTLGVLAAFAAVYLLGFAVWRRHALRVWLALLALGLATVPGIGIEAVGLTPYLGAFSALMVPAPWWRWTTALSAVLPLVSLVGGDFPAFFFLMVWPIIGFCAAIRVFGDLDAQAERARAELALTAERERVARDVHDVLGHSLTALSIKAELASRLVDLDPDRARAELDSIQETARQALAEIRATVGGLRVAGLDAELRTVPEVLADAGIETRVSGEVADTDPRHRTLLAWVLRESVTNVVRHSRASHVAVELSSTGLVVTDDGTGMDAATGEGNGLRGMRERVTAAGGTLLLSGGGASGTRVEVRLP
ncbi:Sensor histidine kinase DesK [Nocardioides dokdonensis FR1436]|uniref:Sensor histidine kinase DesK n=1 Tax=Nocardioides dokdonensis FR1436 TaxID=1300347 RepID=A0A1A9GII6_9ACTN|nr:sensor histidine kinase [Nocardioides dokdonensis]ANH37443.1 Sensor histidine kinase DesK [Nocardioides dokdonensis FR1436]